METGRTEILKISHLSRSFGKLAVLKDVNFSIYSREILCVLGPSGCGKTTLLRLLAGLIPFDEGQVILNGGETAGRRLNQLETGMVFQEPRLLPWRTVFANVALPFELMGTAIDTGVKQTISGALELVGMPDFTGNYPHELSGGMRQRVSLARAMATNPRMLFLDEPLTGLDVQSRSEFMEQILRVWEDKRITLLWVTHDLREAIRIADRIIVLSRRPGTVVATLPVRHPRREQSGGPEELELEATLRKLFE
jgi:NitT/TauT family transport system ATP-binding protein